MDKPLVSIIIPVYNAEKTLTRCLESILRQEYRKIEVILVNDGSQDSSLLICNQFAANDSRVLVFNQQNSGVSESRNTGIARASGKYLQFVDSDDWISDDATKVLVERAETTGSDMVIAHFYRVVNECMAVKGNIKTDIVLNKKEFITCMMKEPANFYYGVMWNKLYRRDLVSAHKITCCTELNWCEDFLFNLDYIRYAESFAAINSPIYYYVKTKNSLVNRNKLNGIIRMKLKLFNSYKELFESTALYDKHRNQVRKFFVAYAKDNSLRAPFPNKDKGRQTIFDTRGEILKVGNRLRGVHSSDR